MQSFIFFTYLLIHKTVGPEASQTKNNVSLMLGNVADGRLILTQQCFNISSWLCCWPSPTDRGSIPLLRPIGSFTPGDHTRISLMSRM